MRKLRVLIACEFSGIVRDAFIAKGHDVMSCDLLPSERPGPHYQGDVMDIINDGWDMMIAHPPCTDLAVCGAKHFIYKQKQQQESIKFFMSLVNANINKIAIENPVGIMSTKYRKPDQYIQPWEYGHGETKKTCLWLKNLPLLKPTNIVAGREQRIWKMSPSPERGKLRSVFYSGIAEAMADQWNF
jgi:hypothetical protein